MKRTVEGDLGIRFNAVTILHKSGVNKLRERIGQIDESLKDQIDIDAMVNRLSSQVGSVPENYLDYCVDAALSCAAVETAMKRHCGRTEEVFFPTGKVKIQHGKDLTGIKNLVGTGGVFAYGREQRRILESGCYDRTSPESLRPQKPELLVDECYILFAIGLLSSTFPTAALRIMKKHLKRI